MAKKIIFILLCIMLISCSEEPVIDLGSNTIEKLFESTSERPLKFSGSLDIIDAAVDDTGPLWAIGLLAVEDLTDDILVEFSESVLKQGGITDEFEYPEVVILWLDDAKNEYYQVTKIE